MSAHAKYSPSSAHRWLKCPGSITAPSGTSSVYADEGTAAHTLAERCLFHNQPARFWLGEEIRLPGGEVDPAKRFIVTEEMADAVQVYAMEVWSRASGGNRLLAEQRLPLDRVLLEPNQFGTCDAVILDEEKRHLTVVDLKYGKGVRVYAEENEQLMLYGLAALSAYSLLADFDYITLVVVQPRLDHIDPWTIDVESLRQFGLKAAEGVTRCQMAIADLGKLEAGEWERRYLNPEDKACFFCPLKGTCNALAAKVSAEVFDAFDVIDSGKAPAMNPPRVDVDENEKLSRRYASLSLVEAYAKAVRQELEKRVLSGAKIEGPDGQPFKVVEGRQGHRKYKSEPDAAMALASHVPVEELYDPAPLKSPAEVEKRLKKLPKGEPRDNAIATLAEITERPPGKPTIALGSDKRLPYSGVATTDEFDEVTE